VSRVFTPQHVALGIVTLVCLQWLGVPVLAFPLAVWMNLITALTPVVLIVMVLGSLTGR
jgi:hypothetical protein